MLLSFLWFLFLNYPWRLIPRKTVLPWPRCFLAILFPCSEAIIVTSFLCISEIVLWVYKNISFYLFTCFMEMVTYYNTVLHVTLFNISQRFSTAVPKKFSYYFNRCMVVLSHTAVIIIWVLWGFFVFFFFFVNIPPLNNLVLISLCSCKVCL